MSKKNSELKKYGVDLEKEYNDTQLKLKNLEAKIRKRAKLMQKLSPNTLIWGVPLSKYQLKLYKIEDLLAVIQIVEEEYVNQSKQTEMNFNKK